eukprot:COSAG01_NODE_11701_length_1877_cov_1.313836_2_plen_35_part_01
MTSRKIDGHEIVAKKDTGKNAVEFVELVLGAIEER